MKSVNVTFTDEEHDRLKEAKRKSNSSNWHDYIIEKCLPQDTEIDDSRESVKA